MVAENASSSSFNYRIQIAITRPLFTEIARWLFDT